ncbi:trimethylamine-N-oxide reductase TorA [Deinococcus psychrotolerans]|uniref:trimethylamine-N-oxide reductase n=1 Tax=Deinococcus psychrotolerans TaxID=2489213 RepID=A0A3G8YNL6_9DEIO|nr:trimethylamine-N-oxide reductase TorA [Deinococcus psychrotolerans]AZI44214.1 trimethylamine-N-oxide reductase TorA [Deinococcus psychrotolerans]
MSDSKLSRRDFVKLSAVTGGGAALSTSSLQRIAPFARQNYTRLTANHWGVFTAEVKNGKFVRAVPFARDVQPSAMLQAMPGRAYSETRVRYPMVRASFLKNGHKADRSLRGKEKFVRVSWDQALDLVASEIKRVKAGTGNKSIFTGSYGWHDTGAINNPRTLLTRMMKKYGGSVGGLGDYSTAASQVIMPHVLGTLEVYEQQTSWDSILANTKLVVLWGADLLKTNQIGWAPADHYAYEGVSRLRKSGIEVICINPLRTETAKTLKAEWVAVRPQTDVALMLGMAHTLYQQGKYSKDFIENYTVGFDQFLGYLTGKTDGVPKNAEWAAKITDIPAKKITELALKMADKRTMLMSGWAVQRAQHGEQVHWMLVTLASMIGQIGLPGGGFGLSYHYDNGGSLTAKAPALSGISSGELVGAAWPAQDTKNIPVARAAEMLLNPGATFNYNGKAYTYPDIHLVYWAGGNPMHHHYDRNRVVKAWRSKPETIIIQDPFWTATAKMADIVLPASTTFEREDITQVGSYSQKMILVMQKVIDPLYESKSDYWIFSEISKRLGFGKEFTEGRSEAQWVEFLYNDAKKQADAQKIPMPPFDEFSKKGYVEFAPEADAKNFVRFADFRKDPEANPLGTPSGKIEIYSQTIEGFHYASCPPHPTWMEPAEWLGAAKAEQYPLQLLSPHPAHRLHSQLDNTAFRQTYEVAGREPITLHPADASARGIKSGDVVRVFNDRGQALAGAVVSDEVRRGAVVFHEGGWYDPADHSDNPLCKHGDVNTLTLDIGTSDLAQGGSANTALVQLERYKGTPPAVTAFNNPV